MAIFIFPINERINITSHQLGKGGKNLHIYNRSMYAAPKPASRCVYEANITVLKILMNCHSVVYTLEIDNFTSYYII